MTQVSSLYLHVPFCKHLCNYCDFYKRKLESPRDQFEDFHRFLKESGSRHDSFLADHGFQWKALDTIYLGGGTPSLWGEQGAKFFRDEVLPVSLSEDCEFTMEIDPGTWSEELLRAWKDIGLNRISIGTQTLDRNFLKVMDRVHSLEDSLELMERLQKEGWNFSLDFLLGIPYSQSRARDIKAELDLFLSFEPKHVSLYILNARSKYPYVSELPEDAYVREEYLFVSDYLRRHGFHHYEVSNFAVPGFESRHNLKYWRGESVAALGPTGTGFLSKSADEAVRYKWKVTGADLEIENLTKKELDLEKTYLGLRLSDGIPIEKGMECVVASWKQQHYAFEDGERVKLTGLGFLMLDSLMEDLFRWEIQRKR